MNLPVPQALLEALSTPVVVLDSRGRIVQANGPARRTLEGLGTPLEGADLFQGIGTGAAAATARNLLRAQISERKVALDLDLAIGTARLRGFELGDETWVVAIVETGSARGTIPEGLTLDAARTVASEVRHGINNALMGLLGQAEVLEIREDLPEWARAKVESIRRDGERIRDLVKNLEALRRS